jgi:hypothetical protein
VPPEPWHSFLQELDELLTKSLALHCLGGFVVAQHYGVGRETADIDFLSAIPRTSDDDITALAGLGSPLHRKYRLYVQRVTVATPPADYSRRLARMFPLAPWKRLTLLALDPHDLALSKLERNAERDRQDVMGLARAGHLDPQTLKERYFKELRPYLLNKVEWHDRTMELWLEIGWPSK